MNHIYLYRFCVCLTDSEISHQDQISLNDNNPTGLKPSAVLINDSTSTHKLAGDINSLSPTETAMDAWNPMESHFLSNWNLYQGSINDDLTDSGRGN